MSLIAIKKNIGLLIASVLVAIIMYLVVQSQLSLRQEFKVTFNIEEKNLPPGLVATPFRNTIDVTFNALPDEMDRFQEWAVRQKASGGPIAEVDLSDAVPEDREYPARLKIPTNIDVDYEAIPEVVFKVESQVSDQREVEVGDDQLPKDMQLVDYVVTPDRVTIQGPESDVNKVSVVRVNPNMENWVTQGEYEAPIELRAKDGSLITTVMAVPNRVRVKPFFSKVPPSRDVSIQPTTTGVPEYGYKVDKIEILTPQAGKVRVTGAEDTLLAVHFVETEPISIAGAKATVEKRVPVKFPPGMRPTKTSVTATVRVVIVRDPAINLTTPPPTSGTTGAPGATGTTGSGTTTGG